MKSLNISLFAAAATLAACRHPGPSTTAPASTATAAPAAVPTRPLYVRLGGQPAIEGVVKEFVARLAADRRVKFRFANTDIPKLTSDLIDFVCLATGGPCVYKGREMRILHASMHVTEIEWNATVEALVGALDQFKVPGAEKGEVLAAIGSVKGQIVDPPKEVLGPDEIGTLDEVRAALPSYGGSAEILGAALDALRAGQRSYAEQLFSMAEAKDPSPRLAALAPMFRHGSPPRVTAVPVQMRIDSAPQPAGAVGGSEADEPAPATRAARASLEGTIALDRPTAAKNGAFGIVMLTPSSGGKGKSRTPKHRVIEQRGREFAPHLLAIPVGSTVAFPNFDDIYHNVFSRSDARPFDLGIFKNGQAREVTFDKPGIVRIGCNLHANMSTSVIVVDAPHYAVTDASGHFRFERLTPGTYAVRAWTERSAEPVSQTVTVKPGANQLTVAVVADAPPGTGQDKFGTPRGTNP